MVLHRDLDATLACVLRDIMNNKVFYQHPNLMRVLGMHETVMEVMVNVLGGDKSQVNTLCVQRQMRTDARTLQASLSIVPVTAVNDKLLFNSKYWLASRF